MPQRHTLTWAELARRFRSLGLAVSPPASSTSPRRHSRQNIASNVSSRSLCLPGRFRQARRRGIGNVEAINSSAYSRLPQDKNCNVEVDMRIDRPLPKRHLTVPSPSRTKGCSDNRYVTFAAASLACDQGKSEIPGAEKKPSRNRRRSAESSQSHALADDAQDMVAGVKAGRGTLANSSPTSRLQSPEHFLLTGDQLRHLTSSKAGNSRQTRRVRRNVRQSLTKHRRRPVNRHHHRCRAGKGTPRQVAQRPTSTDQARRSHRQPKNHARRRSRR